MYDMYPWDSASQGDYPPQPLRSVRNPARRAPKPRNGHAPNGSAPNGSAPNGSARDISPAQAVQIALDRRDNGGEGHPASHAATLPAASQARK
jgi:hypothetical protein